MFSKGMIKSGQEFQRKFKPLRQLGEGADGKVTLWRHNNKAQLVAVKTPAKAGLHYKKTMSLEICNVQKVGSHPNIVKLLGWDEAWYPYGQAIFFEYCDLGDLEDYRQLFTNKQRNPSAKVPELAIWKLLADMSKGLDHLHNRLSTSYIHGDLKPDNILVSRPRGLATHDRIPIMPTFRLADIARLIPYRPWDLRPGKLQATFEYMPPLQERKGHIHPAVDIWGLGATVQQLALGMQPTQSRDRWLAEWLRCGNQRPTNEDLERDPEFRRRHVPVIHRPINATKEDQAKLWDVKAPKEPYSDALNDWYSMCLDQVPERRVSADVLMKWFVPLAENQMEIIIAEREHASAQHRLMCAKHRAFSHRNGMKPRSIPLFSDGFTHSHGAIS